MNDTIKGALIGAIIPTIGSFAIFLMGNFSTQSSWEKATVEVFSERFDSVEKDMSYEEALQAVYEDNQNAKNEINSLTIQLDDLQNQIKQQNSIEEINKIMKNATDYWNNSDYVQCLTLLKNSKSKSIDIESLYEQYSDEYVINLLSEAELLIVQRDYTGAINVLKEGKAIVFDDKMLNDKITEINNNQPIKLSTLKISESRFFNSTQDPVVDTVGNRYSTGNLYITYAEGESNYGYGTFYLGGKYTSLSGIIAVSDESENRSDVQLKGWIEIGVKNNDNEYTQLWTSPTLSRTTSTIEIPEINLSDSEWLEIRYYNNGEYWNLAAGYHSLRIVVSDVMLYKD